MPKNIVELKDRLNIALEYRNMRPVDLSKKTGIPKSAISQYMSGYTKPKDDRVYLISKALDINEGWLCGVSFVYKICYISYNAGGILLHMKG